MKSIPGADEIVLHGYEEHMEPSTCWRNFDEGDRRRLDEKRAQAAGKSGRAPHPRGRNRIFNVARQLLTFDEAEMMASVRRTEAGVREGSVIQTSLDMIARRCYRFAATLRTATLQPS